MDLRPQPICFSYTTPIERPIGSEIAKSREAEALALCEAKMSDKQSLFSANSISEKTSSNHSKSFQTKIKPLQRK
ncbi:hypothetical protein [Leptospira ainazelensis]|uniref:hypothetical protein n=1 Tax=Leptospira ainazelensis TaxID=2810034 RepID=UPI0038CBFBC5